MSFINERVQPEGLTFDDVLLIPAYSEVLPREVNVQTRFSRNISLNIPIVSAAMDTVTEAPLAIALAREGGIGVIHKNMTIAEQAAQVRKVKRAENGMIYDPVTISKDHTVGDALNLMKENKIGGIPVVDADRMLIGIVTNRDLRFQRDMSRRIEEVMTPGDRLVTTHNPELSHAQEILLNNKIEKLPVVDDAGRLVGLITYKDITKVQDHPNACKDAKGRLRVAAGVGYIAASIKDLHDTRVGDTITDDANPAEEMLPGYRQVNPMVFCGIYPADGADYESLKDALEKLHLNDASLTYDPETSQALGFGFRCGFLGLLHMEIIQERLEREFDLDLITTAPSVIFKVYKTDGTEVDVDNPSNLPPIGVIEHMEEPFVKASIHTPQEYVGALMEVCQNKRGVFKDMVYEGQRVCLHYEMPLAEIIFDFFDQIKSRSRGYASYDYELCGYQESDLVKLDILLNGDPCDALSMIVHRDRAYARGRSIAEKLKDVIPRQMFEIPIQAAIGGKVIARETVKAMRKDVLAKCYGGDISRKRKLLEKQKEGKKRMRQLGNVQVPSEAFMAVLKMDE